MPNAAADPAEFRHYWRRDGAVLVPQFLSVAEIERLTRFVTEAYRICDGVLERNDRTIPNLFEHYAGWHGIAIDDLERHLRRHDPVRLAELRTIRRCVHAAVNRVFGVTPLSLSRWRRMRERSFFRRHNDDSKYVPWHIDADAARTADRAANCFNVWLPLAEVGETAPSLEFVLGSQQRMRAVPLFGRGITQPYRSDEWVAAHAVGERWIPTLKPGDAVLFDQFTLHRTQLTAVTKPYRDSCEFRFMSIPGSWIRGAGPILADQGRRVFRFLQAGRRQYT